jgi:hypothetical protein
MSLTNLEIEKLKSPIDGYDSYEAYLDSFVTQNDLTYLGNVDVARQLIELGINVKTEILTKDEFYAKKQLFEKLRKTKFDVQTREYNFRDVDPVNYESDPFLSAIAKREEDVVSGRLLVILFMRVKVRKPNGKVVETSGYIDLAERLKTEDFRPILQGTKLLLPKKTDLSYYNWYTGMCHINDSKNFKSETTFEGHQLVFKNKKDRKAIVVTAEQLDDEATQRVEVSSKIPEYEQTILFDHYTKKRS